MIRILSTVGITYKSMKNALYVVRYAKGNCRSKATQKIEKSSQLLLNKACLNALVSQAGTGNRKFHYFKFHSNFLETFKLCQTVIM